MRGREAAAATDSGTERPCRRWGVGNHGKEIDVIESEMRSRGAAAVSGDADECL